MPVDSADNTREPGKDTVPVSAFRQITPVYEVLERLFASRLGLWIAAAYFVVVGFVYVLLRLNLGGLNIFSYMVFEDIAMLTILAWIGPLALTLLIGLVLFFLLSGVSLVLEWLRGDEEKTQPPFFKFESLEYIPLVLHASVERNTTNVVMKYTKLAGWVVSSVALTLVNLVILLGEAGLRAGYGISLGLYQALRRLRGWIDRLIRSMSAGRTADRASQRFPALPAVSYLRLTPRSSVEEDTTDMAMKYAKLAGWVVSNAAVTLVNLVVLLGEAGLRAGYGISLGLYEVLRHLRGWIDGLVRLMSAGRAVDWASQRFPAFPAVSYLDLVPLSSVEENTTDLAMKYAKLAGWIVSNVTVAAIDLVIALLEALGRVLYGVAYGCYEVWYEISRWVDRFLTVAVKTVKGTQTGLVFVSLLLPLVLACTVFENVEIEYTPDGENTIRTLFTIPLAEPLLFGNGKVDIFGKRKSDRGMLCLSQPPKCYENTEHVASTRNYLFFEIHNDKANRNDDKSVLVIPKDNMRCFAMAEGSPACKEPEKADDAVTPRGLAAAILQTQKTLAYSHQVQSYHALEIGRNVGEIQRSVGEMGRALYDHARDTARAVGEVQRSVGEVDRALFDHAWAMAEEVGKVHGAVEEVYQGSRRMRADIKAGGRYVFVDRRGTETRYVLAGFDAGEHELRPYHRVWLWDLYRSIRNCRDEEKTGPQIRMLGFASAEPYEPPASPAVDSKLIGLCKPVKKGVTRHKNCDLANQRLSNTAGFLRHLRDRNLLDDPDVDPRRIEILEGADDAVAEVIDDLKPYCAAQEPSRRPKVGDHIVVEPWCKEEELINSRFAVPDGFVHPDRQPHFLNRSVHFIVEDPGSCKKL